jgi:hypothetical protein
MMFKKYLFEKLNFLLILLVAKVNLSKILTKKWQFIQNMKRNKNLIIIIKEILVVLCLENHKRKVKAIKISIISQKCNNDKVELRKLCKLI